MSIFSWLRRMAKHAFLAGVNDALCELEAEEPSDWHDEAIEALKHRLQTYRTPGESLPEAIDRTTRRLSAGNGKRAGVR